MREREREPDEPIVSSLLLMSLHSRLNRSLDFRSSALNGKYECCTGIYKEQPEYIIVLVHTK